MNESIIKLSLLLVSIIHLIPISGVLGSNHLEKLYGLTIEEHNLLILMQHRAVLFGILAFIFMLAAFKTVYQPLAFIVGFASVTSFIIISYSVGQYNAQLSRVCLADIIALISLTIGGFFYIKNHNWNK